MFRIKGKQMLLTNKVIYLSFLAVELRASVHPSVDVYVAKNSVRIHITSRVDLECLRYRTFDVINNYLFFKQSFR